MIHRMKQREIMKKNLKSDGLKSDPDKIKEIENMLKPKSNQELLSLLGFINYQAKFC